MKIEVLDIDLAGELEWWHGPYDIRYLRSYTWPRIKLRYTLKEAAAKPSAAGKKRSPIRPIK